MPGIPFPLQPVLTYKESLVDVLERELAQLFTMRKRIEMVLVALHQERQGLHHRVVQERQGLLQLNRLWRYQVYLDWLGERIEEQERRLAQLDDQIEEKRRELIAALQEKRILEKLKEKAKEQFLAEMEHREADFNDEMTLARFAGQMRMGR